MENKTNNKSIASLILGICGLFTCGITSIVGIILGVNAKKENPNDGLATAGIIVSIIITVISIPVLSCIACGACQAGGAGCLGGCAGCEALLAGLESEMQMALLAL
ncbi:MAG: DUF4190 domain-containing protein [Oscillospiraceae bacterium]|nr:DUF4190 domain-containing protein [Oscillospiraceae bacterium]